MGETAKVIQLYRDPEQTTESKVQSVGSTTTSSIANPTTSMNTITDFFMYSGNESAEQIENFLKKIFIEEQLIKTSVMERDENDVRYLNEDDFILETVSKEKIKKIKFHANKISKYVQELEFIDETDEKDD